MKKLVLIPDSFKGTLSSQEICTILDRAARTVFPDIQVVSIPVADGGEGTVDAFLSAMGGQSVVCPTTGPYGAPLNAVYGLLQDNTAVIEMAAAAGLPLVGDNRQAGKTSTYGVGTLIRHALDRASKKVILGLGGSATNDGGCGCAAALGIRFLKSDHAEFVPVGETLLQIDRIDASCLDPRLQQVQLTVMCDIDNPLCGPRGAAAVFGPQKGADRDTVALLDAGLLHLSKLIKRDLGISVDMIPGAGAAGGMGAGAVAFLGGQLQMGIQTVLDAVQFDSQIADADFIISGEGKLDSQTLGGKVIAGVAAHAKANGIPLLAIVGHIEGSLDLIYTRGLTAAFSINRAPLPFEDAKILCRENLYATAIDIFRLLSVKG